MASINAAAAHPVAIREIHWSSPGGKPLSKYGWNFGAAAPIPCAICMRRGKEAFHAFLTGRRRPIPGKPAVHGARCSDFSTSVVSFLREE